MQFGRYYEEFEVGAVYKHWPGKTVTEYDDHLFCLLTMNHHPLHLDAAYAATTQQGKNVVVERLPASELLARELAEPRPGVLTVVWHSVVQQYLAPVERARVAELLAEAGARASARAPLAHLAMEPVRFTTGGSHFAVTLTTWPGGMVRELAEAQGHGPPVLWR